MKESLKYSQKKEYKFIHELYCVGKMFYLWFFIKLNCVFSSLYPFTCITIQELFTLQSELFCCCESEESAIAIEIRIYAHL